MAEKSNKKSRNPRKRRPGASRVFQSTNYIIFGAALLLLIVAYLLMLQGPHDNVLSRTIAPVLLVISYCVLIPLAILYRKRQEQA